MVRVDIVLCIIVCDDLNFFMRFCLGGKGWLFFSVLDMMCVLRVVMIELVVCLVCCLFGGVGIDNFDCIKFEFVLINYVSGVVWLR